MHVQTQAKPLRRNDRENLLLVFAAARRYSLALEERGSQDFRRGVLILGVFAAVLLILIGAGLAL